MSQFVTWFNTETGKYTQNVYPIHESTGDVVEIAKEETLEDSAEDSTKESQLLPPPEEPPIDLGEYAPKAESYKCKLLIPAGIVLAVLILGIIVGRNTLFSGEKEKNETASKQVKTEKENIENDNFEMNHSDSTYSMDNIIVSILPRNDREAEYIKISGLGNLSGQFANNFDADMDGRQVYEWAVKFDNCSVSLSYFYKLKSPSMITVEDMQCNLWLEEKDSFSSVELVDYVVQDDALIFQNVVLPDECSTDFKMMKEQGIQVCVLMEGSGNSRNVFPIIDSEEQFGTATQEQEDSKYLEKDETEYIEKEETEYFEQGENVQSEMEGKADFVYAGEFICDRAELGDNAPRITLNEDGTFTMLLNLGDLMASTSGTFTWEETDEFYIYLHFDDLQGSIGSDAVVILTGPDGLYFMSEGFGLMGYGDSTGFFDRM